MNDTATATDASPKTAAETLQKAVHASVRKYWALFLIQGIIMFLGGVVALIHPLFATVAVTLILGWVLIISGIAQVITLIGGTKVPHFWMQVISAVLSVVVGFLVLRSPALGVASLVLLMIVFFMIEGVAKIVLSLTVRPLPYWGLVLVSGILGVAIALWLIANPAMTLLFLGIFVGIQLIAEGVAIAWLALQSRRGGAGRV